MAVIAYFRRYLKFNIKSKLIQYTREINSLNFLINAAIELNNKPEKLVIGLCYSNCDSKARLYFGYTSYYSGMTKTNK